MTGIILKIPKTIKVVGPLNQFLGHTVFLLSSYEIEKSFIGYEKRNVEARNM